MSDKQRNPKLDIEINTPVVLTIGKKFWEGTNKYGKSFAYEVTSNGSEYTLFASEFVHERFQSFGQGQTVRVVKRQTAGEKNAHWEIGPLNGNGNTQAEPKRELKYEPSTFNREAYREQRIQRMHQAYEDAVKVRDLIGDELTSEDLRSIAISFVIEENRDHVPLNPVEKPPDANIPALLEDIKQEMTTFISGHSETEQEAKAQLLEKAFGVRQWQPITQMDGEQLIEGLAKLKAAIQEEIDEIPF